MIQHCLSWLKAKCKQHYIFLHVPSGLYVTQKVSIIYPATSIDYELMSTPTIFYSYFGRTENLKKFLRRVLRNNMHMRSGNFTYLHQNVDPNEFELVRYHGKV